MPSSSEQFAKLATTFSNSSSNQSAALYESMFKRKMAQEIKENDENTSKSKIYIPFISFFSCTGDDSQSKFGKFFCSEKKKVFAKKKFDCTSIIQISHLNL